MVEWMRNVWTYSSNTVSQTVSVLFQTKYPCKSRVINSTCAVSEMYVNKYVNVVCHCIKNIFYTFFFDFFALLELK